MSRRLTDTYGSQFSWLNAAGLRAVLIMLFLPGSLLMAGAPELLGERTSPIVEEEIEIAATPTTRIARRRASTRSGSNLLACLLANKQSDRRAPTLARIADHKSMNHRNQIGAPLRL